MNVVALGIVEVVAVVAALGILLFLRHRNDDLSDGVVHVAPPAKKFECEPESCNHEWEIDSVEDVEMTIGYCSYGGSDPMGIVTYTHYYCPKCGDSYVEESAPVPL